MVECSKIGIIGFIGFILRKLSLVKELVNLVENSETIRVLFISLQVHNFLSSWELYIPNRLIKWFNLLNLQAVVIMQFIMFGHLKIQVQCHLISY